MKYLAVVTTVASREEARRMARSLVERGLAACVQISEVESFYRWDGAVQNEPEFRVLCKTIVAKYESVAQAVRDLHSYDLPAIHAYAIDRIDPRYAAWVESNCAGG